MAKASRASRSVELERKFAVPESGLSPSFHGMSGVVSRLEQLPTQHLEATYFDTERHELAANRITLRRRSGGSDEGWHLKLPTAAGAGPEARTEVRVPLGPDLPPELRDMVLAIVRDHPLHPVARISTARDVTLLHGPDGAPLAEFCDDRVTAWRVGGADGDAGADGAGADQEQQWREWELELVDGRGKDAAKLLDRLTNRLLEAGAAPAGHASKLAKVLGAVVPTAPPPPDDPVHRAVAEQVAALLEWDRAVRADSDDAIHQMRVTIRQIRSLLQASEEEFGLTDDATILSELRELAAVLGVARDAEVLAERYRDALDALPPEMVRGPVRARLVDGGWQRYKAGLNRSLKARRGTSGSSTPWTPSSSPGPRPARTIPTPLSRPGTNECTSGRRWPPRPAPNTSATRRCTQFARPPSDFATWRPPPDSPRSRRGPRPSRRCSAITRTAWSAGRTCWPRPTRPMPPVRTPSPTVCCSNWRRS
jgi:hypothetical protein